MLLFAAAIGVTALLFFQPAERYPVAFLCTPLLVWAAFRFRGREVVTVAACMSMIATWATVTGHGQFVMADAERVAARAPGVHRLVTLTALMMSALVQERRRAARA